MKMKKLYLSIVFLCGIFFLFHTQNVSAASKTITYRGQTIATYNSENQMVLVPSANSNDNYKNINYLVAGDTAKTLVIPSGSTININGVIRPGNNTTILANGATIIGKKSSNVIFAAPDVNLKNLSIIGGVWRSPEPEGRTGSLFAFSFVDGLLMDGVDCNANYIGHAIEVIACKNVTIQNCTVTAIGSNPKNCLEEQIQIDLATKKTAPRIAEFGKQYVNGQTCENVYILNNTVTGARAVGINWTASEKGKWKSKFHKNIVIRGNTLTGTTSEALAYFNVIGGDISNNMIITNATRKQGSSSYTIGVHIALFGKSSKTARAKLTITGNTIKGKRNGIHLKGCFNRKETKCLAKFGTVTVKNNTIYCKKGKKHAIVQVKKSCKKLVQSKNKLYKWK